MRSDATTTNNQFVFHAHDLLWMADGAAFTASEPLPEWVNADLLTHAPVVVRREQMPDHGIVPVGIRGGMRNERFKGYLRRDRIVRCVTPEMLARDAFLRDRLHFTHFPAMIALDSLASCLDATGLRWGPTGGVGFSLATVSAAIHIDSDLDLLVRADVPLTATQMRLLKRISAYSGCRIDMQVDTGIGAFSFTEWARNTGTVLLKTDCGPFITKDPWNQKQREACMNGWLS